MNIVNKYVFYLTAFFKRNISLLILLTTLNYLYSIEFIGSFSLFFAREGFFLFILLLRDHFRSTLPVLSEEDNYIEHHVSQQHPFLKFRIFFGVCTFVISFIINSSYVDPKYEGLVLVIGATVGTIFTFCTLFRIYVIINSPQLAEFYDIPKAIKHHGVRSFSTTSKLYHVCKACGATLVALGFGNVLGHKLVQGDMDSRSYLENKIAYHTGEHHITARTQGGYRWANALLDLHPDKKDQIADKVTGHVRMFDLSRVAKELGVPEPKAQLHSTHTHEVDHSIGGYPQRRRP